MAFFGQPPLAALLPLSAGQNLADLPDKNAALANLGTLSTSNIMLNSVPMGTIIPFWGSTAPVGYLPCNGQTINSATYPDLVTFLGGTTSATLPDLPGEFLRGWDNGRGLDTGRANLSVQTDAFQNITGSISSAASTGLAGAVAGAYVSSATTTVATPTGSTFSAITGITFDASRVARTSTETRPHNVSVLYCMKAYGALINTSTANMGNVLTELSNCTKLTQFGVSLAVNGYQKLPSGLIIQWGQTPSLTANASGTVTYPISFPTAFLAFSATGGATSGGVGPLGSDATAGGGLSGLTVWAGANGALGGRYIVIGY
eukprot:gnl/Spiro4/21991_TR10800_c0_g1_i1.p1 gnl/Spiro4/21991_TR10800_c0_g1~~gnl/Spiro4/21991_TR10800_c0_g1_i1.p1  ORF type:complete len:317 (+),score=-32.21 gnl/Spiro4/21991_TR10800_c0_g1_i1:924-1874(+)